MRRLFLAIVVLMTLLPLTRPAVSAQGWPPKNGATAPATCAAGEIFFQTTATTTSLLTCITTNRWVKHRGGDVDHINPMDYGAACNGSADDTVALQAAFDAARDTNRVIKLPGSTCVFLDTLTVGNEINPYAEVSLEGVSENLSILAYGGPNDRPAIALRHVAYFTWSKFAVIRSGAFGTSTGILLERAVGETGTGTYTLTGTFSHMAIGGFNVGMQVGGFGAASEMWCHHCVFNLNNIGWANTNQNTLNMWFTALGLGHNTTCGVQIVADAVTVIGGHSANNDVDFCLTGAAFGELNISDYRSELFNADDEFVSGTADRVTIRDSLTTSGSPTTQIPISLSASRVELVGNNIGGKVSVEGADLQVHQNRLRPAADGNPIAISGLSGPWTNVEVDFRGNIDGGTGERLADRLGIYTYGVSQAGTFTPWITYLNRDTDSPTGGLALHNVRSLNYGSPTIGRNIRDRATFATSATVAFTFQRTVTVTTSATSPDITFTSGVLTAADIGKKILIPNAADACLGGQTDDDYSGRISELLSATSARLVPHQWWGFTNTRCAQAHPTISGAQSGTVIGADEPDANYLITGISCSATGETFGWSNIATTGFTLTSSNASSTATCNFMIIR